MLVMKENTIIKKGLLVFFMFASAAASFLGETNFVWSMACDVVWVFLLDQSTNKKVVPKTQHDN